MIWGNTHKAFLLKSQYSLAGKAPGLVQVSGGGTAGALADPEAGWLEVAAAREEAACCRLHRPSQEALHLLPGSSLTGAGW